MQLSQWIAEKIAVSLGYDEEQKAVIAYGLGALEQMIVLFVIALLFGLAFRCLPEAMVIFWGVGLLRRSSGGHHCKAYIACILTSSLSVCLMALACRFLFPCGLPIWANLLAGIVPAVGWYSVIAWKRVPLAAENKPITNPKKIARLRRQCLLTVLCYLALAGFLLTLKRADSREVSVYWALVLVFWWQGFTLTKGSGRLASFMDRLFLPPND